MDLQLFASQEKTEAATPRKREEARRKGQVSKSVELTSAITLLTAFAVLQVAGPFMADRLVSFGQALWEGGDLQDWSPAAVHRLLIDFMVTAALIAAPIAVITLAAGLAANFLQVGFLFSLEPITPDFNRINPGSGFKRIFSRRALADLFKSVFKVVVVGLVAYTTLRDDIETFPTLIGRDLVQVTGILGEMVTDVLLRAGLALLVMALLDYFYQRWEFEQSLRMSKQEIKDELRQTDGSPEIRSRIRQKQREMARQRMMQDVAKADVVVTNPTHFAVALAYKTGEMDAPKVLAKGQGFVALRIREIAEESGVPVIENPPVARQLFQAAAVGQFIPADLYQAVAEVLALVFRLKEKGY